MIAEVWREPRDLTGVTAPLVHVTTWTATPLGSGCESTIELRGPRPIPVHLTHADLEDLPSS